MDNFIDDYFKEFSQKLKDFNDLFNNWWKFKSCFNYTSAGAKWEDIAYWFFMQSFAERQVNQFADKLPEKGKELIDGIKEAVEQVEKKDN